MRHWFIEKIKKNTYKLSLNELYIVIHVTSTFEQDYDINILNKDMSEDNIIFMNNCYPTAPEDLFAVIGNAYLYKGPICMDSSLVTANIVDTNCTMTNAKNQIELFF